MRLSPLRLSSVLYLLCVIALCFTLTGVTGKAYADDTAKIQALRQTGKQLLDVGSEQYRRGMYKDAQLTLLKAAKYKEYLSISDATKLNGLLEQVIAKQSEQAAEPKTKPPIAPAQTEVVETKELEAIQPADSTGSPQEAVSQAPPAIEEMVPVEPAEEVNVGTIEIIAEANAVEQPIAEVTAAQPIAGANVVEQPVLELPPAREINEEWLESLDGQPIEQPAEQIIEQLPSQVIEQTPIEVEAAVAEPCVPAVIETKETEQKESYIEVIKQKQRIQQGYTRAMVNDAIDKARKYLGENEFARAADEAARAKAVVEKNKLLLGDTVYGEYTNSINQLQNEIIETRKRVEQDKAAKAQAEAQASQERLRSQQTADREKRIEDLMIHAEEYQDQQRYEEALGQIEMLLAIDPLNKKAQRTKQILEDIINLRRQVQLKKEIGKEETDLFYDAATSMIPHAELLTYPNNWQDITARRKTEPISGLSPVDAAVYKQLETMVDLSSLNPDMPLEEAIEMIRTAIEPPLKLSVRWKDLSDNAYIERDTQIGMQGVSGLPLGKGLKELLDSVSGGVIALDYAVEAGVVTVATRASLPKKLIPKVYDITELIQVPAAYETDLSTGTVGGEELQQATTTAERGVEETTQLVTTNVTTIMDMIQNSVSPESWYVNGGDGMISAHGNRLIISQTPEIHEQIQKLIDSLREAQGEQVSIETRFLFVSENFLEDIGLDSLIRIGAHGKLGEMIFQQGSYEFTTPGSTHVPGTLAASVVGNPALDLVGGVTYGSVLDDLTVSFFLRATQAHVDTKTLTAPKVTVLSSERAYITVQKETSYISDYDFEDITATGEGQPTRVIADPVTDTATGGVTLNVTPTISSDKRYVLLDIGANYTKSELQPYDVFAETGQAFPIELPVQEYAQIQTRVSVPDGGTLLIGGQKLGAEINKESGVPGASKIPLLGRLFSNRSKVKDQEVLLILVKPTIILRDEAEREYFAPLEQQK